MTLGEKIKQERKRQGLTQADLAAGRITRNMISLIEKDSANPSVETLKYIAERLNIPLSYIISDDDDAFYYSKMTAIEGIKAAYTAKKYQVAVLRIEKLGKIDDELAFILADSCFELGKKALFTGSLFSAKKHFLRALELCGQTCYNTDRTEALSKMYCTVASNIATPLLEFNTDEFNSSLEKSYDIEFYNYLTLNYDYNFSNPVFSKHLQAKKLIREKNLKEALTLLSEAYAAVREEYNAFVIFGLYTDLEICYKQLCDFEKAYKYSGKRFSLLEGFKS